MFHFDKDFAIFVGVLSTNVTHKHFALQISVSVNPDMELTVKGGEKICGNAFILNSNIEHKLISRSTQLSILFNPLSSIGYYLGSLELSNSISMVNDVLSKQLIEVFTSFECEVITFIELCKSVSKILSSFQSKCELDYNLGDDRIVKAIEYMTNNFEKVLSVEEVAEQCYLSPSRFLHLFKEKTNINFRRYQLWNKTIKSLPYLKSNSITDTAHTYGFSDVAHYSRTIKETFGVTPKIMALNNS